MGFGVIETPLTTGVEWRSRSGFKCACDRWSTESASIAIHRVQIELKVSTHSEATSHGARDIVGWGIICAVVEIVAVADVQIIDSGISRIGVVRSRIEIVDDSGCGLYIVLLSLNLSLSLDLGLGR